MPFSLSSSFSCWLGQVDAKTAWCTSGENFDHNEGEHGCFDLQTKLRTCVGEFDIMRFLSLIALIRHWRRFTAIIHYCYLAPRNSKNLAPNKRTNFCLQDEENF
jgi:hypothetical protein